ncbi:MAG: hypothetical protein IPP71_10315 [Bacteroidetes bacterium]|nr:hypothetical protein [Bacteroidota bacterium]
MHNDTTHGTQLLTGSNDDGASEFATAYTLNAVSPPQHPMFPRSYLNQIHEDAIGLSHSRISKDYTSDQYHYEARRLAALVVQKLSRQILYIMEYDDIERRREATIVSVFTLIDSYLSPPDPSVFAWWEFLQNEDNGAIDALLSRAEQRTPVTVNQCMWSPLVGLEATRHSSVRTFGMFNPAIGAVRLGLASLTGGDINDILIGAIPSATFQFNIGNSRAALSTGGLTNIPFGRLNTLIQDEANYFPESQIRNRSAPEDKPFSSVGVTFNLSLE